MPENCWNTPVSYTHLDVYKRQLFIYIQEEDIIVKNGSENGVEYNRNTGKPYMLLRPYSYEIEAKEYPGQEVYKRQPLHCLSMCEGHF